jgi:dsDNA-specific endonuclease/ATPase MutS2
VRIIHGKGTGFQRNRVRAILAADPLVAAVADAPPQAGGWGATLVDLRPARRTP